MQTRRYFYAPDGTRQHGAPPKLQRLPLGATERRKTTRHKVDNELYQLARIGALR